MNEIWECPLCGGVVNIGQDNRCTECGEVIEYDEEPSDEYNLEEDDE